MSVLSKPFSYSLSDLKYDLTASIVVFLVAIPLCLGIALASGAPLFSGIVAGIVGGIVVGFLSESSVSVSGPAAGMVAVVLAAISQLGSFQVFLLALMFAGVLQIIIGSLRAGFIADYIPSNVIQGLLCAIGILIILKQLPFAFTYASENQELMNLFKETSESFSMQPLLDLPYHLNEGAASIAILCFLILIFFDKTKNHFLKAIPGPIVAVIIGTLLNEFYIIEWVNLAQTNTELVNIPVHANIAAFFQQFTLPTWEAVTNHKVYLYAVILAAVASLEALLNLEAIEKIDNKRRYCSRNRELVAQGCGNIVSGLIGGLPITSVIARSSVNIQTGARTKAATIIHGFLILLVALALPKLINRIPLAALAAILIYVGYKLTKPTLYKQMYAQGFRRFLPFIITIIAIISTNLLTGTLIGLFFSFFFILKDNSQIQLDIINEKYPLGSIKRMILPQHMSFLRKASLVAELDLIPDNSHLIIDARASKYIDRDILEVLDVFVKNQAAEKQIAVNMVGFKDNYEIHNRIEFVNVTSYDTQSALQPTEVLDILKEGNKRFINEQPIHRSIPEEIKATSTNQHPIAIVLGCIDSRVPIETIFDMGVGDVFVARVAGNVVNDDMLASMEFACGISGAKLILVLGHTYCGAIKAACDDGAGGHLGELLNKIKPAIDAEKEIQHERNSKNVSFVTKVTKLNIDNTLQHIYHQSPILKNLIDEKSVGLMGAIYDIKSGTVHFHEKFFSGT